MLSHVWLFGPHGLQPTTLLCPWDFRQEYWSRLPFSPSWDLSDPRIETAFISCVSCVDRWVLYWATREARVIRLSLKIRRENILPVRGNLARMRQYDTSTRECGSLRIIIQRPWWIFTLSEPRNSLGSIYMNFTFFCHDWHEDQNIIFQKFSEQS